MPTRAAGPHFSIDHQITQDEINHLAQKSINKDNRRLGKKTSSFFEKISNGLSDSFKHRRKHSFFFKACSFFD